MKNKLFQDSSVAGQRALQHYLDGDLDQFFLQASVSLELAGKATLASIHPALLIDRDFDSLLHVCDGGKHAKSPPWKLRTIGAQEVLKRCVQIEPKLNSYLKELQILADLRNSVTHLGLIPEADARKVFIAYAGALVVLCQNANIDLTNFFQDFEPVIQIHRDEAAAEILKVVAEKVAKARTDFERRYSFFDDKERKALFATLVANHAVSGYDAAHITCPACNETGIMSGEHVVEWEVDYDKEGHPENAHPSVTLVGDSFTCLVCGLELSDGAELIAAGLEMGLPLENVDPADFYGEPDF